MKVKLQGEDSLLVRIIEMRAHVPWSKNPCKKTIVAVKVFEFEPIENIWTISRIFWSWKTFHYSIFRYILSRMFELFVTISDENESYCIRFLLYTLLRKLVPREP